MKLFEEDTVTVSRIHTVQRYELKDREIHHYNPTLSTYELIFFLSGERETTYGTRTARETPGTLRYLPKGHPAGTYTVKPLAHGNCIDIYFDAECTLPDHMVVMKDMEMLRPLFTRIFRVWQAKKSTYYPEAMAILYEIIRLCKQKNEQYVTTRQSDMIQPAYDYMIAHFTDPDFDYSAMCRTTGLSYDYFKKLFIRKYGLSPVKKLTELRLDRAKELLITGHYKISEVSDLCGFANSYYFSAVFKKQLGIPPKSYRSL